MLFAAKRKQVASRSFLSYIPKTEERKNMDLGKKIKYLQENNLSIYIEKDGEIIFQSHDAMLKPLFLC